MDGEEAKAFLQSLICKNLRVTTTDSRMFWGSFKCTDAESNLILQHTYEYRQPSQTSIAQAAAASTDPSSSTGNKVKVDMTSRYLGLVVIPGKYIVKIEVEEFASQIKNKNGNKDKLKKQPVALSEPQGSPQSQSQHPTQESTVPPVSVEG